jgi:ferredoxin
MNIKKVWALFFSPTGTSRKIVDAIVASLPEVERSSVNLTYQGTENIKPFQADELVVIGVPVYAGRVAPLAVQRLKGIKGKNTPVVLVALYGNREYEDALVELRDIATAASLLPVGAAAFIGEHSFSSQQMPTAQGRPDHADLASATSFGRDIFNKIDKVQDLNSFSHLQVPGNTPYKESMGPLPVTPKVDPTVCTLCGLCISSCPGGAIAIDEDLAMDVSKCIFCCACIKTCPEEAVFIDAPLLLEKRQSLHENCATRKEPELYF